MAALDLRFDPVFSDLLNCSYHRLTGLALTPQEIEDSQAASWLYSTAPFAILAHNTASDPTFIYGNQAAQSLFGYSWDELTVLPSRLSAEAPEREERQRFLEQVQRNGFVSGYSGIRITKDGRRFRIEDATVWQLVDDSGTHHGQAAMLPVDKVKTVV
jgi:PAS domain S-box-containing protein